MSDPSSPLEDPSALDDEFGVLDIVESFTAMRHEWKTQTRETRSLSEEVIRAVEKLEALSRQLPPPGGSVDQDLQARRLAETIAEIDFVVDRAVAAANQYAALTAGPTEPLVDPLDALNRRFEQLGWLRRALARSWHRQVCQWLADQQRLSDPPDESSADGLTQGLELMRQRVRRLMEDSGIERLDVLGLPFDANQMNAVESVDAPNATSGQVIEQLRPAYTWNATQIKYADVRVAR